MSIFHTFEAFSGFRNPGFCLEILAVLYQLLLTLGEVLDIFNEIFQGYQRHIIMLIIISFVHPDGLSCLRELYHVFPELSHSQMLLPLRRVSLRNGVPVQECRLEHIDGFLFQSGLFVEFGEQIEGLLLVDREFECAGDRDHVKRNDEDAPEADGHAHQTSIERLGIEFAVACARQGDDCIPHSILHRGEVLPRHLGQRSLQDTQLVPQDDDGEAEAPGDHEVRLLLENTFECKKGVRVAAIEGTDSLSAGVDEISEVEVEPENKVEANEHCSQHEIIPLVWYDGVEGLDLFIVRDAFEEREGAQQAQEALDDEGAPHVRCQQSVEFVVDFHCFVPGEYHIVADVR